MSKTKSANAAKQVSPPSAFLSGERLVYLLLFGLAFLLYANTFTHEYALDDRAVMFQNKFVQQGFGGFPEIMSTFYWNGFWEANAGLYRPMSLLVFAMEWAVNDNAPGLYHFVNVVLYALTCVLVYKLLRRMLKDYSKILALVATVLFIVMPMHTEVVANIKSLDEILSLLFFALTMQQLLNYSDTKKPLQLVWATLLFYCALLSKEGAVLYFPMFALALYYFTKTEIRRIAVTLAPLAAIAVLWYLQHSWVIAQAAPPEAYSYQNNALLAISPEFSMDRLATAIGMFGHYLYKLLIPYPMSYDYSFNEFPGTSFGDPVVLLTLAAILGLLFVAFRQMKNKTVLSFSIFWFFITFALTSNLFVIIGATMADRFLFVPSLGFCIAAGWFVSRLTGHVDSGIAVMSNPGVLVSGVVTVVFMVITFNRNSDWKNDYTLFAADVEHATGSSRTHYNWGTAMMNYGDNATDETLKSSWYKQAEAEFITAAKIDTGYGSWNVYGNLGVIYSRQKRYAESVEMTRIAIKKNPYDRTFPSNLGDAYVRLQKYDSAKVNLEKAIKNGYVVDDTWLFLGIARLNLKDTAGALEALKNGAAAFPGNLPLLENYGNVLGMSHKYKESIAVMEDLYNRNPSNPGPLRIIAVNYEAMGDKEKMKEYLQRFMNAGGKLQ